MATLVAAGALSHSPLITFPQPDDEVGAIERFRAMTRQLGGRIIAAKPDVLVIIGQDHFRTLFYDLMPPFVIGTGRVEAWGDWKTVKGQLNSVPALGRHLHRGLLHAEFDVACSYDLLVDHGITGALLLMELPEAMPIVPVIINTTAPPMPTPYRCYKFGQTLGEAIATFPESMRVAVLGSGGMSHSPPSGNVESQDQADAAAVSRLIHGREHTLRDEARREENLLSAVRAGKFHGSVRPDWDHKILNHFTRGEAGLLAGSLDEAAIDRDGGNGGQEIRTWLAAAGACEGRKAEILGYEPIECLITGMGVISIACD
jgi:2,3-dihydroxyphenylpropionate 1,2-dioxygenase